LRVWLNGALVEEQDARISPADHGFLLGDGVFETLRSYSGRLPTLREHLDRLAEGTRALGIATPSLDDLERATHDLLAVSELEDARLRITVTSGAGPPGLGRGEGPPTVLITAVPLRAWPPTATAVVAPWPHDERSPLAGVKTTSRVDTVLALGYARQRGADEALFLNGRGDVCEASTANVFAVFDGRVTTPPLSAGCLAGITRDHVLELCKELAIDALEEDFDRSGLSRAQELFLTSSTRGVQPLVAVEGRAVGTGDAGPLTGRLADAYSESLARG
jgi:branched-chain amino acid aminotransferase